MPVCVAQTVQKRTVKDATVRHDGNLVSVACHLAPLAAQPPATRAWEGPRATRWWMRWRVGTEWLCSQWCAVACDADKITIVASGGAPDGPFLHRLGDADGHLLPLSPAVRVR